MQSRFAIPQRYLGVAALLGGLALPVLASPTGPLDDSAQDAREAAEEKPTRSYWRARNGEPAPDFELPDLSGQAWKLSDQRGKIVVLEWFNPDCPIVQAAHDEGGTLRGLGNRMHAAENVVWVAINSGAPGEQGHGAERNRAARQQWSLEHPLLLDEAGWVGSMYGATTTPHMYVIDAAGKLAYVGGHGEGEGESPVVAAVENLRAGEPVPVSETKNFGCAVEYPKKAEVGLVAPRFTLPDTEGQEHSLADHLGQVVVLEWFNPDCPIVKVAYREGNTFDGYARSVAERGGAWLAINSGGPGQQGTDAERNRRAREEWSLPGPVLLDEPGTVGRAYGATTTPHMFVVDARGVLAYVGAHDDRRGRNYIEEAVTDLLAGKPVRTSKTKNYG